jgi:hypothetical protein
MMAAEENNNPHPTTSKVSKSDYESCAVVMITAREIFVSTATTITL